MKLPNFKNLLTGGAAGLIDSVKGVISEFHLSPEDRKKAELEIAKAINEHTEKMADLAFKQTELEIKDMADARNREIQIATSDKAPLINKIIQPIIALIIVLATLIIWALILFRNYEPKINEAMIIGSLTTMAGMILSYYFGSSTGSKTKADQLDKMMNK